MAKRAIISLYRCVKKTYSNIFYREGYNIETFERLYKKKQTNKEKKKEKNFYPKKKIGQGILILISPLNVYWK